MRALNGGSDSSPAAWLDARKNLSGRALAEATGLVRVRSPDGTVCTWRERAELEALLEEGCFLPD